MNPLAFNANSSALHERHSPQSCGSKFTFHDNVCFVFMRKIAKWDDFRRNFFGEISTNETNTCNSLQARAINSHLLDALSAYVVATVVKRKFVVSFKLLARRLCLANSIPWRTCFTLRTFVRPIAKLFLPLRMFTAGHTFALRQRNQKADQKEKLFRNFSG